LSITITSQLPFYEPTWCGYTPRILRRNSVHVYSEHEWRPYSRSLPIHRYSQADIRESSLVRLLRGIKWYQQARSIFNKIQMS